MKRAAFAVCLLLLLAPALSLNRLERIFAAPSPLNLSAASKNFGNVSVGASTVQSLTLKNNQNTTVAFAISIDSSEFTQTNTCGGALAGKAQCRIDIRFSPARTGTRSATVAVTNGTGTLASASLTGNGTSPVTLTPASVSFGSQLVGSTSIAKSVSVTNNQSTALTGIGSSISGDFAQTGACPATLAPGATCAITLTFTPTVAGAGAGVLTILHSAFTSPQTVSVSGSGTIPGLNAISVTPINPSTPLGASRQFVATGHYNNNTTQDLTEMVVWTTSVPGTATVSNTAGSRGLATPVAPGSTTITATAGSIAGSTALSVTAPALVAINVTPISPSVALGRTQQFTAIGTYTDGSSQDLTTVATWSSAAIGTATISVSGLATSVAEGTAEISASSGGISASTTLTVTPATLTAINVTPVAPSIALGTTRQFTATGTYTNGSTLDLTSSVTWSSLTAEVAAIDATGLATSVGQGLATISAQLNGVLGSAELTVTPATLVTINVTPLNAVLAKGRTQAFTATGTFTDGSSQDLTSSAVWTSSAPSVATITAAGVAAALATGNTTITAASGSISGDTTLSVAPAELISLEVTPLLPLIPLGTSKQFVATGTYTDGSTQDLSASVSWSSDVAAVATIGAGGLAASVGTGATSIAATSGSIIGSTTLTVTPAALVSIAVTPQLPSAPVGMNKPFTATGTYTDGTIQSITDAVTWTSSDSAVATISNAQSSAGLATAIAVGTTTIAASFSGVSGTSTLTVTPAVVVAIEISPVVSTGLPMGRSQQLVATATYSDGSTLDVTSPSTWTSTDSAVVTVSGTGLATAVNTGSAEIRATKDGVTGAATMTVTAAVLVSISVDPASASIALGTTQPFTATGHYSDSTTQDLTASVHWSSSNGAVATLNNAAGTQGLATSHSVGAVSVAATSGAISGTASLTVGAAELVSIAVTPFVPSIPLGRNQQFTATGTFTDGSTQDITTTVAWSTSLATVAIISSTALTNGLAESSGIGMTTITATLGTVSGHTELTVGAPAIVSIAVTPVNAGISVGQTQAFTATATYTNGTTGDVTTSVLWTSSATSRATIGANGVATGVSAGSVTITAASGAIQGTASLAVVALPAISSFTASPTAVRQGFSSALTAVFSNGTAAVDNGVGSVSSGIAKTVTPSTTTTYTLTVTNSLGASVTASATVTVHTVQSVAIVPTTATIPVGSQGRFTATATYSDSSTSNVSNQATWTSSDAAVATVNATGLVSGVAAGPATITATFNGVSGTASVTVTAAGGAGAPRFVYGGVGGSAVGYIMDQVSGALTAVPGGAVFGGGSALLSLATDPSSRFVYGGSNRGIYAFTSDPVTGRVTYAIPSGTNEASLGYGATALNSAIVNYRAIAMHPSGKFLLAARDSGALLDVYFVDAGMGGLTLTASYPTGLNPRAVTIDPTGKFAYVGNLSSNTITAYAIDETSGTLTTVSGSPFTTVTSPQAVAMHSSGQYIYVGGSTQIGAYGLNAVTGALSPISGSPYTTSCCLSMGSLVGEPTGRFVYTQNNSSGVMHGYSVDQVSGALAAVPGSPFPTTNSGNWVAADASGRFVFVGSTGMIVRAIDQTTGALTAVTGSPFGAASGSILPVVTTSLGAVSTATLVSVQLTPNPLTITTSQQGVATQFTLAGTYSDGTTRFLTESATWSSSTPSAASVSNQIGTKGRAVTAGYGTTTISASFAGQTATATLTVQQPPVVSITVTPTSPTIASGTAIQFLAVATYSDNSTQTVTGLAAWASSDTAVVTVNATALGTAVATGTATITATFNGVSGTASVTVTAAGGAGAPRFVYGGVGAAVVGYIMDQVTGALTAVPGGAVFGGNTLFSLVTDPNSRFVYGGSNRGIYAFTSDPVTGRVTYAIPSGTNEASLGYGATALNSATVNYRAIAMHPSGKFLLAPRDNGALLDVYFVDAGTGGLTLTASYPTGANPRAVTIEPTGKFAYVANSNSSTISAYAVNETTGVLTAVTGSPFTTVSGPQALAMDPSGEFLYVGGSTQIGAYGINAVTGALSPISGSPYTTSCCLSMGSLVVEPTGRFVYAQNTSAGVMHGYSVDQVSGALAAVPGSPFPTTNSGNNWVAVDASGRFVFVGSTGMIVRAIDQTTGALTAVTGSPFGAASGSILPVVTTSLGGAASTTTLVSVQLTPTPLTVTTSQQGVATQFTLAGTYSDGTTRFLTESATWSSSTPSVASVSNHVGTKGRAVTAGYGTTTISASFGGQTAIATLTVQQPAVVSIAVTPASPTIASGTAIQFLAVATYSDNSTQTVTGLAAWASSDTAVVTVNATALATAVATGTATITATFNGVSGTASVTVTAAGGAGAPRFVYGGVGGSVVGYIMDQVTGALTAVPGGAVFGGNTLFSLVTDPNSRFVYGGSNRGIYAFTSDPVTGRVTYAIPSGTNEASLGYGATALNSAIVNYRAIAMHPSGKFLLAPRDSGALLDVYFVDAGTGGLTLTASYPTGVNPRAVTIEPTGKFAYVVNAGSSTITAYAIDETTGTLTTVSGSPFTTVTSPQAVAMHSSGQYIYVGGSTQIGAYGLNAVTGALSPISGSPYTTSCCLSLSSLVVDPTGRFVYAQNTSAGVMHGYSVDQVSGALTAVPGSPFPTTNSGNWVAVDASGRFAFVGGTGMIVRAIDQTTGALTAVTGSPFVAASGSILPVVTTSLGGAVSTATLVSVQLTPNPLTITTSQQGVATQFTLVGTYSDGTTRFLTESGTWSSSTPSVASVSNQVGTKGRAVTAGYGTTTISASFGGQTAIAMLTVQQPAVVSIAVTPASPTIASGTAIQFQAVATYSDNSTQNVTSLATWSSSDTAVAAVSNVAATRGLTTAVAPGTATITATYNGVVSNTATITVQ